MKLVSYVCFCVHVYLDVIYWDPSLRWHVVFHLRVTVGRCQGGASCYLHSISAFLDAHVYFNWTYLHEIFYGRTIFGMGDC